MAEIAVFDIGFTPAQRQYLARVHKVCVYDIEMTHPDLKREFASRPGERKPVRGWYAWKPVAIKQALELFPYVLYVDAGVAICTCLDNLFSYIQEKGYFLLEDPAWGVTVVKEDGSTKNHQKQFLIEENATTFVLDAFQLHSPERAWVKRATNLYAAVLGLPREMLDTFVKPMCELTRDFRYFQDDGSGMYGFGWARHDQVLFGIHARLLGLELTKACQHVLLSAGDQRFSFCCSTDAAQKPDIFLACKGQMDFMSEVRMIDS